MRSLEVYLIHPFCFALLSPSTWPQERATQSKESEAHDYFADRETIGIASTN